MSLETEYGLFTSNELTGQSAEEVYQEWLANKDKPSIKEVDKIDSRLKEEITKIF